MNTSRSMVSFTSFLTELQNMKLSPAAKILADPSDKLFIQFLKRWSDIGLSIPGAIIVAGIEDDVVKTVALAVQNDIPFVLCSGGHSLWSTIDARGFILDLRQLKAITVDTQLSQITLQSGILVAEANEVAWKHGLCLPLGTANTAGVIPMALGGGLSAFSALMGYTSDNIVSAKLVAASGGLIRVSSIENAELLYALRGAGQLFGVVTELTLQAYPSSTLGSHDGSVWTGALVFPVAKAESVLRILSTLTEDVNTPTMGICIITSPPPTLETALIVIPVFFGDSATAEDYYRPLLDLYPFSTCKNVPSPRINDAGEPFGVKGGFKRWAGAGLNKINFEDWTKVISVYEKLKTLCPDASATGYAVEWNVYAPQKQSFANNLKETAFGHRDIHMWAELLSWYTDPESHGQVLECEREVIELLCESQSSYVRSIYQNWSRDAPLEHMYPGENRLQKLKELKRKWDPKAIFTSLFL